MHPVNTKDLGRCKKGTYMELAWAKDEEYAKMPPFFSCGKWKFGGIGGIESRGTWDLAVEGYPRPSRYDAFISSSTVSGHRPTMLESAIHSSGQ